MTKRRRELILKGKKLKDFRLSLGISLANLGTIVQLSPATLSRMETGGEYSSLRFDDMCKLIGVAPDKFLTADLSKISRTAIFNRIANQAELAGVDRAEYAKILNEAEAFHGPSYLIKMSIENGFLDEFRFVREVQDYIQDEFGVQLISSSITNALMRKNGIVYQQSGRANYNEYKFVQKKRKTK